MSLDHRVQTLFSLLGYLPQYVVDGTNNFVQASLRRAGELAELLNNAAKRIRTFRVWNAQLAASTPPSTFPFVTYVERACAELEGGGDLIGAAIEEGARVVVLQLGRRGLDTPGNVLTDPRVAHGSAHKE